MDKFIADLRRNNSLRMEAGLLNVYRLKGTTDMSQMIVSTPLVATAASLRSGQLDLLTLVDEVCQRVDAHEPHIHALVPEPDRRTRLLREATALQERFPDPVSRSPLYGILLGVKDIFNAEGFPTHAGSQLPPELFRGAEASCVTKLRDAGALLLGKTITTEFAYFEPGPTRNPYNLEHTPGGSSSGSAAAVAAGFCPLALGTQTIGSTIRPAAFCGIVGFKPSYGRISTDGLILCSASIDTIGFFTQDVASIALVAPLLCNDWRSAAADMMPILGVPDGPYLDQASPEGRAAFEKQVKLLEQAGYRVRRVEAMHDIDAIALRHRRIVAAEMAQVHSTWFAMYETLYRPRTAALIREGQEVRPEELAADRAGRAGLRSELEGLMAQYGIDLWISPAAPGPAPEGITSTGDPAMNLPWTHSGLPAIALPAGRAANGLPLGLQVVGAFMADEQLVAWAQPMAEVLAHI
ncbi:MAG TPA: amidase [Ktedonobacteraceae bacterium]|nr:amidase [Ktedonobacteraceae bacterium]